MTTPWAKNGAKRLTDVDRHAKRANGRSLHDSVMQRKLYDHGLKVGGFIPVLDDETVDWLAANVPKGMTISEYLVKGVLPDVMAEDRK